MTGISKGSFYNFYDSKEILFFTVLEEYQKSIIDELTSSLRKKNNIGADEFTELIYNLYQNVKSSFIINIWSDVRYIVETPYSYPELTVRENLEIVRNSQTTVL